MKSLTEIVCSLVVFIAVSSGVFGQAKMPVSANRNTLPLPGKTLTEMKAEFEAERAALKAAAHTNFMARCALDFRWRSITNEINIASSRVAAAKLSVTDAKERDVLAKKSRQMPVNQTSYRVKSATKRLRDAEAELAAAKLSKLNLEDLLLRSFHSNSLRR